VRIHEVSVDGLFEAHIFDEFGQEVCWLEVRPAEQTKPRFSGCPSLQTYRVRLQVREAEAPGDEGEVYGVFDHVSQVPLRLHARASAQG
jgi:hypothetical protein